MISKIKTIISIPKLVVSLFIVIILFLLSLKGDNFTIIRPNEGIENRRIIISETNISEVPYEIMYWNIKNNMLKLKYNEFLIDKHKIHVFGKTKTKDTSQTNITKIEDLSKNLNKTYSGSFMVKNIELLFDIDADGEKDRVIVSAKVDTIHTRGFAPVNTFMEDDDFPLELVIKGDYDLKVYFYKEPLLGKEVRVTSNDFDQTIRTNSQTGMISLKNMNLYRNNINVLYKDREAYFITSYVVEGHKLLSKEHYKAIKDLLVIIGIAVFLILVIIFLRKRVFRGGKT